jgi:hypothetical protein
LTGFVPAQRRSPAPPNFDAFYELGPDSLVRRGVPKGTVKGPRHVFAPGGKLSRVLTFTFTNAKIARLEVIGDPSRLRELDISVVQCPGTLARVGRQWNKWTLLTAAARREAEVRPPRAHRGPAPARQILP